MIWKNREAVFTYWSLGALRGLSPAEGGSGKATGFEARGGDFPPSLDKLERWHKINDVGL
jgi:hypothetical protein